MSRLQEAIVLNNEGAQLLQKGQLYDALHTIRRAILLSRGSTAGPNHKFGAESILRANVTRDQYETIQKNGLFYVYSRPLIIIAQQPSEDEKNCPALIDTFRLYSAFNLALIYHQIGIVSGQSAPLQQAMDVYHVILRSRRHTYNIRQQDSNNKTSVISYPLLRCLVLNNLAQLYSEQLEYGKRQYCLQQIRDIIGQTGCFHATKDNLLTSEDIDEIILNTVFMQHPPTLARAA